MTTRFGPSQDGRPIIRKDDGHSRPAAHATIAAAVTLTVVLRLPTLLDPHYYTDEGIFAAVAQRLLQGHALYLGAWDDKPPFIFWLYALLLDLFGPSMVALRIAATLAAAGSAVAVVLLATRLADRRAGLIAGIAFAVVTSTPLLEGNLALTELFGAVPAAWALTLVILPARRRPATDLIAGALLASAFLFKQVFALDAVAAGVVLLAAGRAGVPRLLALMFGFAALCAVTALVLVLQGGLGEGLYACFGFYALYLRDGSGGHAERWLVVLAAGALSVFVIMKREREAGPLAPATVWLLWALAGTLVGGRPYGHYLLQAAAPCALWLALVIRVPAWRRETLLMLATGSLALVLVGATFVSFVQRDPTVSVAYYANVTRLLTGQESRAEFRRWYTWRVEAQDQLLVAMAEERDRTLFVWGEYPWLYPLTGAENPTRFPTSFHISFVEGSREEMMAALHARPPRFIIWEGDEWRRLPGFDVLLQIQYEHIGTYYESRLYRRR